MKKAKELHLYRPEREVDIDKKSFKDEIDIQQYASDVQGRIQKDVSGDYVLANLNDSQKISIPKLHSLANYTQQLIERYKRRKKWIWNNNSKKDFKWEKRNLTKEEAQTIQNNADELFDTLMNKMNLIVILERNKKDNPLLEMLLTKLLNKVNEKEKTAEKLEKKE